jgi:serine/threonine protein kinase
MRPGSAEGEGSVQDGQSVTDVGEPALIRASSLEIARGSVLAGRYQVEAIIGRGGSGIVLRAFDRVAQVPVAVKILKPELATDPHWVERFSRELRLARQIQHPNVCRVFDIDEADGHWFITMELATGGTLRDQLAAGAPARSIEQRFADIRAVVDGLAAIHDAGIVHRDVKPDNYLRMDDGRLVLTDFGLATNPGEAPIVSVMVGTPYYMAPEVVMGEPATPTSDVWAAGIMIHEVLVGRRPGKSSPTRMQVEAPSPSATRGERALLKVCAQCLDDQPERRPPSGTVLRAHVEAAESGPWHSSSPAGSPNRLWGALAVAVIAIAALFARRMWQPAIAAELNPASIPHLSLVGTPRDLSRQSTRIAQIDGRVHCFSTLRGGTSARIVWGAPRRAEDIDLTTGSRSPSPLPPSTYQFDCPQLSPRGDQLLFTRLSAGASSQIMRADPRGEGAIALTSGAEPLWLPSGDEFVFNVDVSHVGVFALPTMTYNILPSNQAQMNGRSYRKAVSPLGDVVAVLYNEGTFDRILEIHSLPDLKRIAVWQAPNTINQIAFQGGRLTFSDASAPGTIADFDWRTGQAHRRGYLPGREVFSTASDSDSGKLLLSRVRSSDVWLFDPLAPPRQLTTDGRDYAASWSPSGDVLVGRQLQDGRMVIIRYDHNGAQKQLTNGPTDSLPHFGADGTTWLYADYGRQTIVRCEASTCVDIQRGEGLSWPMLSPDDRFVSFVSEAGTPHLHIVDKEGRGKRDLGPTAIECAPVWTSATTLWAFSGAGTKRQWNEIDVSTGLKTGRSKLSTNFDPDTQTCGLEAETPDSPFYQRARVLFRESWELRRSDPAIAAN